MKYILLTIGLMTAAHVQAQDTCGVQSPFNIQRYDDFYLRQLGCDKPFVDDAWSRFHMAEAEDEQAWEQYGSQDMCNMNLPFGRTINALQLLAFASTDRPHCDTGQVQVLDWGYCYAGAHIEYLAPRCDGDAKFAAVTGVGGLFQDNHTDLYRNFFYEEYVFTRAAAVFHEARHAEAECLHTDNCPAGEKSCDVDWNNGCGGSGLGAYAMTVLWLARFATNAQPHLINDDIRMLTIASANAFLQRNFEQRPCFTISMTDGSIDKSGC